MTKTNPFISIEGATATGKSNLAFFIAKELNSQIISADSRQIYKHLDIGTAKATPLQMSQIKHHMINIINPNELFSAGQFAKKANQIIQKLSFPIVAGGTGFYVKALLNGLSYIPRIPKSFRKEIKSIKNPYQMLIKKDPTSQNRIHPNDKQRAVRALEVLLFTGKPIEFFWEKTKKENTPCVFKIYLFLDREELYKRINNRLETMVNMGLLEEISSILDLGYSWSDSGLKTIGYKEFKDYFEKTISLEMAKENAKREVRRFCKRQLTWYKKNEFDLTLSSQNINLPLVMNSIYKFIKNAKKL